MYIFCEKTCGEKFTDNCVFTKYEVEGMEVELPSPAQPSRIRRIGNTILNGTFKLMRGMNYAYSYPFVQPGDMAVPGQATPPERKLLSADIGQAVIDNCVLEHTLSKQADI